MRVLGNTLEKIAWEKGGIYPSHEMASVPCFALDTNVSSVLSVLQDCAVSPLRTAGSPRYISRHNQQLGLPGEHQYVNAEFAVALCEAIWKDATPPSSWERLSFSLEQAKWPGRCQEVAANDNTRLFLDGSHTVESVRCGVKWFASRLEQNKAQVLLFYCSVEKNPVELLQELRTISFSMVLFARPGSERPSGQSPPTLAELLRKQSDLCDTQSTAKCLPQGEDSKRWEMTLCELWKYLRPEDSDKTKASASVNHALEQARQAFPNGAQILAIGSLYLVGSVLEAVNWSEPDTEGMLLRTSDRDTTVGGA